MMDMHLPDVTHGHHPLSHPAAGLKLQSSFLLSLFLSLYMSRISVKRYPHRCM
jgi:hypothetical protein